MTSAREGFEAGDRHAIEDWSLRGVASTMFDRSPRWAQIDGAIFALGGWGLVVWFQGEAWSRADQGAALFVALGYLRLHVLGHELLTELRGRRDE